MVIFPSHNNDTIIGFAQITQVLAISSAFPFDITDGYMKNLAKLDDGFDVSPTVMVGEEKTTNSVKRGAY